MAVTKEIAEREMNEARARAGLVEGSIEALLAERGSTHGDFTNHAGCAQELKDTVHNWLARSGKSWHELPYEVRESLDMILHKIGRIVAGDTLHADHWDDIAGYAKLVPPRTARTPYGPPIATTYCGQRQPEDEDGA